MNAVFDRLTMVIQKHVTTLQSEGRIIIDHIRSGDAEPEAVKRLTHKLRGSSGTAGFAHLYEIARDLDLAVNLCVHSAEPFDHRCARLADRLEESLDHLDPTTSSLLTNFKL